MSTCKEFQAENLLSPYPPKAARLIVTIYGDVVEPRGGVLWMGNLISLCAGFGINESLVRTAVSRLVSRGQLSGQREGRRSFYALTDAASAEYHAAAESFYGELDGECDWIITHCSEQSSQTVLLRHGYVSLGGDVFAGADRPDRPLRGTAFRAVSIGDETQDLADLLQSVFNMEALSADYSDFVRAFRPMRNLAETKPDGQSALLLRLALVHAYRDIRLRDPRFPPSVLPDNWTGCDAHRLFADLYSTLSEQADTYIGRHLLNRRGLLEERPEAVLSRLNSLADRL